MLDKLFDLIRPAEPDPDAPLKMIVGLGNPGKQYEKNRHNVGFQTVELLARRHDLTFDRKKGHAAVALGTIRLPAGGPEAGVPGQLPAAVGEEGWPAGGAGGTANDPGPGEDAAAVARPAPARVVAHRVVLAKPHTFMNDSGRSVAALARFYKVDPADMLVIYDELDLPLGRIRLRPEGGAGGHNGMKSIIRELSSNAFPRLRIGIDRPPGRLEPSDYVLQDFSADQDAVMAGVRELAVAACEHWLAHGVESAMNEYNSQAVD